MIKQLLLGSSVFLFFMGSSLYAQAEVPHGEVEYPSQKTLPGQIGGQTNPVFELPHIISKYASTDAVPVLTFGSKGEAVEDVQKFLKQSGFYTGKIDGSFGTQSKAAVASFQKQANLIPDGIVGFETWKAMINS